MTTPQWVELRELELGARFRFYGIPEQTATLVEKGPGRALIRHETPRGAGTRPFKACDRRGQKVTRTITPTAPAVEPCTLGAQVVPLAARAVGHVSEATGSR